MATTPTITLGTPTKTKISRVEGYDQSVVTFTSNIDLQAWEARATLPGVTPGRGVGLLVESGTTLSANTEATIYVDDEELTNGDNEYTITVYGHGVNGYWSDGSYDEINLFNSDLIYQYDYASLSGFNVTFDTGNLNDEQEGELAIKVQTLKKDWSSFNQLSFDGTLGYKSVFIEITSDVEAIRIAMNGWYADGAITIDAEGFNIGDTYRLSYTLSEIELNHAVIENISLVKVVE